MPLQEQMAVNPKRGSQSRADVDQLVQALDQGSGQLNPELAG